jgi:hypothetical protein
MSNGSILVEGIFYIFTPRNIWKLILFFPSKIFFSWWKQAVYSLLLYPNINAEHIQRHKHLSWMGLWIQNTGSNIINSQCSWPRGIVEETTDVKWVMDRFWPKKFLYFYTKKYLEINSFFSLQKCFFSWWKQAVYSYLLYPNIYAGHIQRHKRLRWMLMPNIFNGINI